MKPIKRDPEAERMLDEILRLFGGPKRQKFPRKRIQCVTCRRYKTGGDKWTARCDSCDEKARKS